MKNASLIINGILIVAVGILFYLYFSSGKTGSAAPTSSNAVKTSSGFKIAYFEMDSLQNSFSMIKDITNELNQKEQALTTDLSRMEKAIYDKANEYQSKASSMSQTESEVATNDINMRRRNFEAQKERSQQEYQNLSFRKTNEIKQTIQEYLKEYNKDKGFSYILSNEPGFMYYRDTVYNITTDIIKGLNDRYKKKS